MLGIPAFEARSSYDEARVIWRFTWVCFAYDETTYVRGTIYIRAEEAGKYKKIIMIFLQPRKPRPAVIAAKLASHWRGYIS